MVWSHFIYLAVVALLALAVLIVMVRNMAQLTSTKANGALQELAITAACLSLGAFAIYGVYLLELEYFAYLDVGADTVDQYTLFYLGLLDSLRDGTFGSWNFNFGLGSSITAYQSWLYDPFNLIVLPLGLLLGNAHLSAVLAFSQCCKVVLSGLLFNRLLTFYCKTPLARILGACLFGLSGYLILWGQHYWLGSVPVAFVALLLTAELLLQRWTAPRFAAVALVSALCMAWSPYCGFMILLGCALYALLRIIYQASGAHQGRQVLRGVVRLALPVFCGILIAGVALIPYAVFLFGETGRIGSSESVSTASKAAAFATQMVPLRWIPMIFSRLLGDSLVTAGADIPAELVPATTAFPYVNCYELLAVGVSACALMLLCQFIHVVVTEGSTKQKVLVAVAALLVVLYCFNNFLPALFNLMVAPKYRSAFVALIPLCLALSVGWERRVQNGQLALIPHLVGSLLTLGIVGWSLINTVNGRLECVLYLGIVFAFATLALVGAKHGMKPWLLAVLCALVVCSSVADGFFTTNKRVNCTQDSFPQATQPNAATDTMTALTWLEDYDSTFHRTEKTYVDWTLYNDALAEGYYGVTAYNSTTDADIYRFFELLAPTVAPDASATQVYLEDADVPQLNSILGVRYLLSRSPVNMVSFELLHKEGSIFIYRNTQASSLLYAATGTVTESDFAKLSLAERRAALDMAVVVEDGKAETVLPASSYKVVFTDVTVNQAASTVSATVEAPADMTASLSVPNTAGWQVYVDCQPVDTFRANIGFIGFSLPAGTHTVEARFTIRGTDTGALMSAAGLVAAVVIMLIGRRRLKAQSSQVR